MLLELARFRALDRPVARVVNARSHFVDKERRLTTASRTFVVGRRSSVVNFKQFNRQQTHIPERVERGVRDTLGGGLQRGREPRRGRERQAQNAAAVVIFDQRETSYLPVAAARRQDRQLAHKWHKPFENQRRAAQSIPCGLGVGGGAQHLLALAVVAEAARLQHRRQPDLRNRRGEVGARIDRGEGRRGDAQVLEKGLLSEPILRCLKRGGRRKHGHVLGQRARRRHRHILELVGHHIQPGGELLQRCRIVVAARLVLGKLPSRRIGGRVEQAEAQPERIASQRQHAPKLPRAKNANGCLPHGMIFLF